MTGKDRIFSIFRHEPADKIPWVPFAGVHAGKLCGYSAEDVLRDPDKLYNSLMKAHQLFMPDGQPVIFDLQIEAEILGCELMWASDSPPSVVTHPLCENFDIPETTLTAEDGRIPMVLNVMKRMKKSIGVNTALYGLITGPFTLASHLRGSDLFMDTYIEPEKVAKLINYCTRIAEKMAQYYIEAGMDVIAVVDPVVSQISPDMFEQFLLQPYKTIFDGIRDKNTFSSFFVCGDATRNIEIMCQTGPDSISIDENIDMVEAKKITDSYQIIIGGNIPLTTTMLLGTQEDNIKFVLEMMDSLSHNNLIISPGCDMPYDTPTANTVAIAETLAYPESGRLRIKNYAENNIDMDILLPDYQNLDKPLVEVFTVDSAFCAACAYIKEAAFRLEKDFGDNIDIIEYKFTVPENVARVKQLGVKNLPSIYVNGELYSSSIIPRHDEFVKKIRKLLK